MTRTLTAFVLLLALAAPAAAQTTQPAPKTEAGSQSSNMGLPPTDGHASNGVGTEGSLDHDHGKASSTVAGIGGSTTGITTGGNNQDSAKPAENQPSVGGGSQTGK